MGGFSGPERLPERPQISILVQKHLLPDDPRCHPSLSDDIFSPPGREDPFSSLSAVLIFVAWNMSELHHFIEILKGQRGRACPVMTFLLTVLIDLAAAVQVGVILSAVIFLKRMTDKTTVEAYTILARENDEEGVEGEGDDLLRDDIPSDVAVFEIRGPFSIVLPICSMKH